MKIPRTTCTSRTTWSSIGLLCINHSLSVLFHFTGEEQVFITVLNGRSLNAENPKYQCYRETTSTIRAYGRYVNTRSQDIYNLAPNPPVAHCCESAAQIINIPSTNKNGFGIFYAQGMETNKGVSTVPTILLRSDGKNQFHFESSLIASDFFFKLSEILV